MGPLNDAGARYEAPHRRHGVVVDEDVGALRRDVTALARTCTQISADTAALIATELATNIVRHTTAGGYVLYRKMHDGIELLAVDRGPGMRAFGVPKPRHSVAKGGSGRGHGLGIGLAGVANQATTFDLYSTEEAGTVILARLLSSSPPERHHGWARWGAVNVPLGGTGPSGDGWAVAADGSLAALVVDGLGHGPEAAAASRAAISAFGHAPDADLNLFITRAHEAMRTTRGGVLGACVIDPARNELRYVGVGNVAGRVLSDGRSESLPSRDGTLGTHLSPPQPRAALCRWGLGATLVLATDGLRSGWEIGSYPGLLRHDPIIVAATLERDHARISDDVTVLVVQDLRGVGR